MAIILLAEDTTTVRMAVRETLIRLGHEVIETTNGAEALARFENDEPDTVLLGIALDIAMPTQNGLSALNAIPGPSIRMRGSPC
jgi:CheY-like chemotaxis protein